MVFRRRADHRRTANIDIFNTRRIITAARNRGLKRVKIDDQHIDLADTMRLHGGAVVFIIANGQQPAMHIRVQCLDAAIHHFGKTGQL